MLLYFRLKHTISATGKFNNIKTVNKLVRFLWCAFFFQALEKYGVGVATGENCHNRVMFKQFLQAKALRYCQIDSCRMAGPNEILSVYLMAEKFGGTALRIPCSELLAKNKADYTRIILV